MQSDGKRTLPRGESLDLLTKLARLVPGVIYQYRLDPDGRSAFPYASPGMSEIYEVTPEEVREDASVVFGRLHPEDHDRVAETISESARTLNTFYCDFRVILPRQGLRWRWSQAHPERLPDGGTLWHGIIQDVTERKLREEALRESEERYHAGFRRVSRRRSSHRPGRSHYRRERLRLSPLRMDRGGRSSAAGGTCWSTPPIHSRSPRSKS